MIRAPTQRLGEQGRMVIEDAGIMIDTLMTEHVGTDLEKVDQVLAGFNGGWQPRLIGKTNPQFCRRQKGMHRILLEAPLRRGRPSSLLGTHPMLPRLHATATAAPD